MSKLMFDFLLSELLVEPALDNPPLEPAREGARDEEGMLSLSLGLLPPPPALLLSM